jgi:hypothetical protein
MREGERERERDFIVVVERIQNKLGIGSMQ